MYLKEVEILADKSKRKYFPEQNGNLSLNLDHSPIFDQNKETSILFEFEVCKNPSHPFYIYICKIERLRRVLSIYSFSQQKYYFFQLTSMGQCIYCHETFDVSVGLYISLYSCQLSGGVLNHLQ